jgi:hypothetical protein
MGGAGTAAMEGGMGRMLTEKEHRKQRQTQSESLHASNALPRSTSWVIHFVCLIFASHGKSLRATLANAAMATYPRVGKKQTQPKQELNYAH